MSSKKNGKHDERVEEIIKNPSLIQVDDVNLDDVILIASNARRIDGGKQIGEDDFFFILSDGRVGIGEYKLMEVSQKAKYQLYRNGKHHYDYTKQNPIKLCVWGEYNILKFN